MPRKRRLRRERTNLAVSYLRTSSRSQDEALSQERQRHNTQETAARENLRIVQEFSDIASGLDSDTRSGFMAMLDFARDPANQVSNIIIDDLSRFSRDPVLPIELLPGLRQEGIAVYSHREGLVNKRAMDVPVMVHSWQNNQLSRATSFLTKAGLRTAMRNGYYPFSTAPYGYRRQALQVGSEEHHTLVPDAERAEVVKRVFNLYDRGHRVMDIVEQLNRENIPPPQVARWGVSTVRRFLRNKTYTGYITIGENPSTRFDDGDDLLEDDDGTDDTYLEVANCHEPLVSEDQFLRVQKRMAANTRTTFDQGPGLALNSPRSAASPNPLSGLLKCGFCGSNLVVSNQSTGKKFMCSLKKNSGKSQCNKSDVSLPDILEVITGELCHRVITEECIREQVDLLRMMAHEEVSKEQDRRRQIDGQLAKLHREMENLMDVVKAYGTSDSRVLEKFKAELQELSDKEERLKEELLTVDLETSEKVAFLSDPQGVADAAMDLKTYLDSEDKAATREFLRLFIKRVDLLDDAGTIEYSLPLPCTETKDGRHQSALAASDDGFLLEHASPSPSGRGEKGVFAARRATTRVALT